MNKDELLKRIDEEYEECNEWWFQVTEEKDTAVVIRHGKETLYFRRRKSLPKPKTLVEKVKESSFGQSLPDGAFLIQFAEIIEEHLKEKQR